MYEKQIEEMLSKMTIEEKALALTPLHNQYCSIPSQDFYGPSPQDVPRGGADRSRSSISYGEDGRPNDGQYHPVAFPSNSSVAMSWDKNLARRIGRLFALEAKANPEKVNILNRPGMNLKRSPLCGRNYDYLSEDPIMTGILAAEYVKGIQEEDVGACPKHFIANNQEFDRMNTNSVIQERVLKEVYLRPWKIVLQKAKPWMIMSSYNKVNGDWVNSSKECMDMLRKDIGYDGVVVSDYLAIHHNKVASHNNDMDIELADPSNHTHEILEALKTGEITEEMIDHLLRRQLRMALHAMSLDNTAEIDMDEFHEEAIETAKQCIVLLKNDDILPLQLSEEDKIMVAGELAEAPNVEGSGSGYMNGYIVSNPLEEIDTMAKESGVQVFYHQGYRLSEIISPAESGESRPLLSSIEASQFLAKVCLAFVGAPFGWESEGYDRADIQLPKNQRMMLDALTKQTDNIIIILTGGSVYDLAPWKDKVKGIIFAGTAGEGYGKAIADIIFGKAEPGGRLAETFPLDFRHTPAYFDFAEDSVELPNVTYSEGLLVGYRWYDTRNLPVMYPFGYGLSYTTFAYTNFKISKDVIKPDEKVKVSLEVMNTGSRCGSQVIQLYIHERGGLFKRPEKELRDFAKVTLKPQETVTVEFTLTRKDFEVYSDVLHKWGVQSDTYDILLNISAADAVASGSIRIVDGDQMYYFTEMSPLVWFVHCPAFHEYLKARVETWKQDFFVMEKTDFLALILPLPFYRMAEPLQGEALLTADQVKEIINYCNDYMKRIK